MFKFINKDLIRIIISLILYIISFFLDEKLSLIVLIITYIIIGYETFIRVIENFKKGEFFEENFLMTLATIGAFFIKEYKEGVAVMLFYEIGEYINDLGIDKSKDSIKNLVDLRSDKATLLKDGKEEVIKPENLNIGDIIIVRPGERVPIDGIVVKGNSSVDTSSITGESIPRDVSKDKEVYSGYINLNGIIEVKVTTLFKESTASRILKVIEESDVKKSKTQKFINKFASKYTPFVVISSLLIFLVPVIFFNGELNTWLYRALIFLVASCPCALILSVPLGYFCGIGLASRHGILIKSSSDLEQLAKIDTFVFDKTGTITEGKFEVKKINVKEGTKEELIKLAAYSEYHSNHPIANSIKSYYNKKIDNKKITDFKEQDGGIKVKIDDEDVLIGNYNYLKKNKIKVDECSDVGTIVYVVKNNKYIGNIIIGDVIKTETKEFFKQMKDLNKNNIVVLSGDNESIVKDVCNTLNINNYKSGLKPIDKKDVVNELRCDSKVCFVGDGINDAIVLLNSDLGISMGSIGSDAAIEASDIVVMNDNLLNITKAIKISNYTNKIVWENIIFALIIKFVVLALGAFGLSSIIMAVFADIGVTVITVLNATRIFYKGKKL